MPEQFVPVVHVEEVAATPTAIEGVAIGVAGVVGLAAYGPTPHPGQVAEPTPQPVESLAEFLRIYGDVAQLALQEQPPRVPYLAEAARSFFENGGRRLYVSRVFKPRVAADGTVDHGVAEVNFFSAASGKRTILRARWPGALGNCTVACRLVRSGDLAYFHPAEDRRRASWGVQARDAPRGALVEILPASQPRPDDDAALDAATLAVVTLHGVEQQSFRRGRLRIAVQDGDHIRMLRVMLTVHRPDGYEVEIGPFGFDSDLRSSLFRALGPRSAASVLSGLWLEQPPRASRYHAPCHELALAMQAATPFTLAGGHDGGLPTAEELNGAPRSGRRATRATGLTALDAIDELELVLAPDGADLGSEQESLAVARHLIANAERHRHRFALIDPPRGSTLGGIAVLRQAIESRHAALYWPWVLVDDRDALGEHRQLPPSGLLAGIYARTDAERGVHKAPANEVLRGVVGLMHAVTQAEQDVLNAAGICTLRFFEGRGFLVWGARTLSAEADWKYVPVRRFLSYVEKSLTRGLAWCALEANEVGLWQRVRASVELFMHQHWLRGMLSGSRPQEAYYVRCDESTMTAADLAAGRLVCEVGVAPSRPAEFIVLRIGVASATAS